MPFDCFEKSDSVGGNWVFGNRNGMSAAYRELFINVVARADAVRGLSDAASDPDFPHHTHIASYFEEYVDHFGLRSASRSRPAWSTPAGARTASGRYARHRGSGTYDALIVANGHHWDQRWPEPAFPGADTFKGTQMHAHAYVDNSISRRTRMW